MSTAPDKLQEKLQDKQKEITFFDGHAAHDSYDVFTPESSARLIDAIVRLGKFKRGDRLAEIGRAHV